MLSKVCLLLALPAIIHCVTFSVKDNKTNKFCLIFAANITGTLHYLNKANSTSSVDFAVPEQGPVEMDTDVSQCGLTAEKLQFDFLPDVKPSIPANETQQRWNIQLEFGKTGTGNEQRFVLQNYFLTVYFYPAMNASETNSTVPHVYNKPEGTQPEWAASNSPNPNGFVCSQNKLPLNLTEADSSLQFNQLKVVAFVNQDKGEFDAHQAFEQCSLDMRTSDLVPIIVGACLAGLVIVVLVAYLIGRARAKRQGYASV